MLESCVLIDLLWGLLYKVGLTTGDRTLRCFLAAPPFTRERGDGVCDLLPGLFILLLMVTKESCNSKKCTETSVLLSFRVQT